MAYTGFKDRVVSHPGRVIMTPVPGEANTYDMSRAEGTITVPGTPFNAETFNAIADDIIQVADDNIITSNELSTLATALGVTPATLYNILDRTLLKNTSLTISSNWDSGYVNVVTFGTVAMIAITNLRRTTATNGYIDVATLPSEISLGALIAAIPLYQDNNTVTKIGAVRVQNGTIQFNTGANIPQFGVYAIGFWALA